MGIYQRILAGKIFFTKNFDKNCRMLVKKLLVADLSKRYGNLKAGPDDIVQHKWFQGVNWEKQFDYTVKISLKATGDRTCGMLLRERKYILQMAVAQLNRDCRLWVR